jgi:hypothetical protein
MIFGGSIEGEEFDHEAVEFAGGRIFVLRRLLDGSSAPDIEQTQLWRVDIDGSNAEFLAEIDGRPRAIESSSTHVYFTTGATGIWRFPIDSPASDEAEQVVDVGVSAMHLTDKLYYATTESPMRRIYRSDLDGGNADPIGESTDAFQQVSIHEESLYFVRSGGLYRQIEGQESALQIGATSTYDRPNAFVIHQDVAYTLSFFGRLASSELDGSGVQTYGPNDANTRGTDILVIGEWVYWSNGASVPIRRMNRSTHEFENLAAFTRSSQGLATDGTQIYTVSAGALWAMSSCTDGTPFLP